MMPARSNDIASILAAAQTAPHVIEGVNLAPLWVASKGEGDDQDYVNMLLHLPDRSVVHARVVGPEAQVVAGRYGSGDRLRAVVRGKALDEEVVIVDEVEPA